MKHCECDASLTTQLAIDTLFFATRSAIYLQVGQAEKLCSTSNTSSHIKRLSICTAMCTESLQVKREILNPNFDGYKLSLDPLPTYSVDLQAGIDEVKLRADQYTLQHIKSFGIHNHLILDRWNSNCIYYIDKKWRVIQHRIILDSQLQYGSVVFEIANQHENGCKARHNAILNFPSADLCLLTDGFGTLCVLSTGNRDSASFSTWKILYSGEVCGPDKPFTILHAVAQTCPPVSIDCLLLRIEEKEEEHTAGDKKSGSFKVLIDWLTFTKYGESYHVSQSRRLNGDHAPFYAAIESTGEAIYLAGESEFTFLEDSAEGKSASKEHELESAEEKELHLIYSWTQGAEDVTVIFMLPANVYKSNIHLVMTADSIELSIKNGEALLKGSLYRSIDVLLSTWIFENQKLEITLAKRESGLSWTEVVVGNQHGEYVVDEDYARIINERLAHLTSDQLHPDPIPDGSKPGISPNDLEECDALPEGHSTWIRLDGKTHTVTNRASLSSNQFLFNAQLDPAKPPGLCLRHDVDGLLWQPDISTKEHTTPWYHMATFNALGYVQASKRDRKYSCCSPSCSFALICDCNRHLHVYHQPSAIPSPLRNRKSGRVVSHIAKQQVISLESSDDIMGVAATDERIYTLTKSKLYVTRVPFMHQE